MFASSDCEKMSKSKIDDYIDCGKCCKQEPALPLNPLMALGFAILEWERIKFIVSLDCRLEWVVSMFDLCFLVLMEMFNMSLGKVEFMPSWIFLSNGLATQQTILCLHRLSISNLTLRATVQIPQLIPLLGQIALQGLMKTRIQN